ncbi:MAG: TonB-dependent receptor domain-containing protein [Terriglobales bacterium]
MKPFVLVGALALAFSLPALAQQPATVRGIVHDPDHRPIPAAQVTLRSAAHPAQAARATKTNANGEFSFAAVPAGTYTITATRRGFQQQSKQVQAPAGGETPVVHILLPIQAARQRVTVMEHAETLNTQTSTTQTMVSAKQIARAPGALQVNSMAMITDFVPGAYVVHDMLHVRGGHQESWFVDGIPDLNTNIASTVGPSVDPANLAELQVQTGGYSAEYDNHAYGFFNAITPSGFDMNNTAQLIATYGNYGQTNDLLSFGGHNDRVAYYGSVDGDFSQLGLYPPIANPLHDTTAGLGAMMSLLVNASPENQFRFVAQLQGNNYQIPNTQAQQGAGIADLDVERDNLVGMTWTHTAANGVTLTSAPFYHFNRGDYEGGPADTPYILDDNRRSNYYGDLTSLTIPLNNDTLTTGFYLWGEHDDTYFNLRPNPGTQQNVQSFAPSANSESGFVEDAYHPVSWLHLNGGVHFTRYSGLVQETATDPRVGAAVELPYVHWIAHGYYSDYYQVPPLDTVSGPLLQFAVQQGYHFVPLDGERDQQWDAGLTIPLRSWYLNFDHFRTAATNFLDHDEIGSSDIFLPLTDAAANIQGNEVTLRSPRLFNRAELSVAWSNQIARGLGPVTGGLLEFAPTSYFYLDHDQRNTVNAVLTTDLPWQAWASFVDSYGSGFVNGDGPPGHLPPHDTVGLSVGKQFTESLSASLNITNVANSLFLLDNSNTFGGTHWEYPRQIYVQLRYHFHY